MTGRVIRLGAARPDLAQAIADAVAARDHITLGQLRSAIGRHGAPARPLIAELRACGFTAGLALVRRPHASLAHYENGLHLAAREWAAGRPVLVLADFAAARPDLPFCKAARDELAWALGRLGYRRAYVRVRA